MIYIEFIWNTGIVKIYSFYACKSEILKYFGFDSVAVHVVNVTQNLKKKCKYKMIVNLYFEIFSLIK